MLIPRPVSGTLLSQAFGNYTTLVTNGTGVYATTAQEDNATLEGTRAFQRSSSTAITSSSSNTDVTE